MRWDLDFLQMFWKPYELEPDRTAYLIQTLANDQRVSRLFLEPHLKETLQLKSLKIRFQGCRVARHDDHIHIELAAK